MHLFIRLSSLYTLHNDPFLKHKLPPLQLYPNTQLPQYPGTPTDPHTQAPGTYSKGGEGVPLPLIDLQEPLDVLVGVGGGGVVGGGGQGRHGFPAGDPAGGAHQRRRGGALLADALVQRARRLICGGGGRA